MGRTSITVNEMIHEGIHEGAIQGEAGFQLDSASTLKQEEYKIVAGRTRPTVERVLNAPLMQWQSPGSAWPCDREPATWLGDLAAER